MYLMYHMMRSARHRMAAIILQGQIMIIPVVRKREIAQKAGRQGMIQSSKIVTTAVHSSGMPDR